MGQSEIYNFLLKLPENSWISTNDIIKMVEGGRTSVTDSIKRMRTYGEVETRHVMELGSKVRVYQHRLTEKGRNL